MGDVLITHIVRFFPKFFVFFISHSYIANKFTSKPIYINYTIRYSLDIRPIEN